MKKSLFILSLLLLSQFIFSQSATDVVATQSGKMVVVTFSLDQEADVYLMYATDNYPFQKCDAVTGDIGVNVQPGIRTITWDVTQDMDKLISDNVRFKIVTAESTKTKEKRNRQLFKDAKLGNIHPWGGLDIFCGYPNAGVTVFIGWEGAHPHRWGLFADYSFGFFAMEKKQTSWQNGHAFHVGPEVMLEKNCCLFFGPGIAWQSEYYRDNVPKFSFRAGVGGNLSILAFSAYVSYPWAIGVGLGLVF